MPTVFPLGQTVLYVDTVAPSATSDEANIGVRRGYWWLNSSTNAMYVCVDETSSAAVWKQVVNTDRQIITSSGITGGSTLTSDVSLSLTGVAYDLHTNTTGAGATGPFEVSRNMELGGAAFCDPFALSGIFSVTKTSSYTITLQDYRRLILVTSGTVTLTLPVASTLPDGWWCMYRNRSGVDLSIARGGSDTLNNALTVVSVATATAIGRIVKTSNSTYEVA